MWNMNLLFFSGLFYSSVSIHVYLENTVSMCFSGSFLIWKKISDTNILPHSTFLRGQLFFKVINKS